MPRRVACSAITTEGEREVGGLGGGGIIEARLLVDDIANDVEGS